MIEIQKDQANVIPFVMVDAAGTEVTGLGGGFTVAVSKAGGAFGASAGAKAELGNGWYTYAATAGECDTDGALALRVTGAGAVQQNLVYLVRDLPGDVWSETTRTLTSSSTAPGTGLSEEVWTVYRGDTLERTFATIAADGSITKAQVTVKESPMDDADTAGILAVDTASGLIRLNGESPAPAYTATFTLPAGVLTVPAATMAQLEAPKRWYYDVQVWRTAVVETIEAGRFVVTADVTRATT